MHRLGIFLDGFHDSNVALGDRSGAVLFAAAEERLSRQLQDGHVPIRSTRMALEQTKHSIELVAIAGRSEEDSRRAFAEADTSPRFPPWFYASRNKSVAKLGISDVEVIYVPHLESHAASAFYCSSYSEAFVFVADGGNAWDPWTCALYHGDGSSMLCLDLSCRDFTDLYMFATMLLGFKPNRHEGKLTGLAAYGSPNSKLREYISSLIEASIKNRRPLCAEFARWKELGGNPELAVDRDRLDRLRATLTDFSREDIAFEVQYATEERVIRYLVEHLPHFDLPICLAGGLFANIKLNQRVLTLGFPGIYIHPAMGDAGLAVGALAAVSAREGSRIPLESVLLGPHYTDREIETALQRRGLAYELASDVECIVAHELAEGRTVARMAGPLEYGPRALGNRSILSSAATEQQVKRLNNALRRDDFMPFAPAILEEHFHICTIDPNRMRTPSIWMTIACNATSTFGNQLKPLVHVDGTIRPQCITKRQYSSFHRIVEQYYELTGVPALLNTSFNMHGEPIVSSPDDAISTFLRANLDLLVIENFVTRRAM